MTSTKVLDGLFTYVPEQGYLPALVGTPQFDRRYSIMISSDCWVSYQYEGLIVFGLESESKITAYCSVKELGDDCTLIHLSNHLDAPRLIQTILKHANIVLWDKNIGNMQCITDLVSTGKVQAVDADGNKVTDGLIPLFNRGVILMGDRLIDRTRDFESLNLGLSPSLPTT